MSEERYRDLFRGAELRSVELKMLEETYQQAVELGNRNGWPEDETILTIFAHGLSRLRSEMAEEHGRPGDETLLRRLANFDGMYSVMKFRAFTLGQENQRMGMALSAYKQEHGALMRLVERLRAELEEAKAARSEEAREPRTEPASPPRPSRPVDSPRSWLCAVVSALCSRR